MSKLILGAEFASGFRVGLRVLGDGVKAMVWMMLGVFNICMCTLWGL